jgi:hypothetical protein
VGKNMLEGQKRAFEAICDSYYEDDTEPKWLAKHFAWVLIFEHDTPVDVDIIAKDQYVSLVMSSVSLKWHTPDSLDVVPKFVLTDGKITVLDAIIQIEDWCHEHNILIGK